MILVFRKGSSHTFHGVDCELKRITMVELRSHEKDGWVLDHRELAETPETSETPEKPVRHKTLILLHLRQNNQCIQNVADHQRQKV